MIDSATQVWNTCGYVRLSREDGDREESNSVTGQKALIRDYLSRHPELRECAMKVDDGFTGSNFERPAFREMISDVKAGKINCIVVKDLSRFGREYLDAGEYIERIFPFLGVRFIAINDGYDSLRRNPASDDLMVPFKNLINEAYCRDASVKTRSQLEIKRRRGEFIGSFAAFGYRKDPDDRHKLVIDEYAAGVVRDIFRWKLEGVGAGEIADRLTREGVPTPMDYKKSLGLRYHTAFRTNEDSVWQANMVLRILQNPVYIGVLEQGRVTTPSYKIKRRVLKPREEWAVVEGCHEAVIERCDFEAVQKVLAMDTRVCAGAKRVEPFCGLLYCGECGAPMIRKTVPSGKRRYVYYVCSAHKNGKTCFSHSLRDRALEEIVLDLLKQRVSAVMDLSDVTDSADAAQLQKASVRKLNGRYLQKRREIERSRSLLQKLYESLADGLLEQSEFQELWEVYAKRRAAAEKQAEETREQMEREKASGAESRAWIERFRRNGNITELDRSAVVTLVERVLIYREHRVEIVFCWRNEYRAMLELAAGANPAAAGEAM